MPTPLENEQQRDDYLIALYDLTSGRTMQWTTHQDIAGASGIPTEADAVFQVGHVLADQGLAEFKTMAGMAGHVAITAAGIRQAEDLIERRNAAGEPRIVGVLAFTDVELIRALEPLVQQLKEELDSRPNADVGSDLESVVSQLRAEHPNRGVIRAALERIKQLWAPALLGTAAVIPAVDVVLRRLGI